MAGFSISLSLNERQSNSDKKHNKTLRLVLFITHVQYTQTDTIRQTDGPLVPMVGFVPVEKDIIPMVLLVNMHLIKGTLIIFSCGLAGYGAIPMVHWYQWYDWYQWKSTLFQWLY